ncbi:TPA: rRNA maturation RNase YbeY, partial [Enterococcus faecium]|nr:rRNA maturation RNase YbeY [Enterococcus faecium]
MDITFMDETNQVSEEKMKEIDDLLQFAASYL